MKLIGITQRLDEKVEYSEIRESLDVQWIALLRSIDCIAVPLSVETPVSELLNTCDLEGIIFSGGNDLSSVNPSPLSARRDAFERSLLKEGIAKGLPIFGACRGSQLICEFFGSTVQKVEGHVGSPHPIAANAESKYFGSLSSISRVNSFHNYGITAVPSILTPSALAEDGTIEAFESAAQRVFCQMWHPERAINGGEEQRAILRKLFHDR